MEEDKRAAEETQKRIETMEAQVKAYMAAGVTWMATGPGQAGEWVNTRAQCAEEKVRTLRAALELGQVNCDGEFEGVRAQRDAALGRLRELVAACEYSAKRLPADGRVYYAVQMAKGLL